MPVPRLFITIAGLAVVGVIALAAGWWFFVRSDAQPATEPPPIPQE